ncbi:MAG: class I SAM-dependent methyltransferase [Syntrophomonadaceae bacterium]|jgi:methyltransferase (TIGR00027 family)|nr:class I SAM-dependent methyltransferase [Syntrophomonadaceae bacterium]MDH7498033.1 class I SAM-dependent methyltransferase [Syntrophomonadaceae bacterium]
MRPDQVSLTAIMTAYLRGFHAACDSPRIFDDALAWSIIPGERRALIEQGFARAVPAGASAGAARAATRALMRGMGMAVVLSRARYAEEALAQEVEQGASQYVILGAGLDTFAFRQPQLVERLEVFEVDHPATQAFKLSRLEELGWELPSRLHFVPVDFTRDDLAAELVRAGFDRHRRSFFSWLGVTMYLGRGEVTGTLRMVADMAPSGSCLVFDFLDAASFAPAAGGGQPRQLRQALQGIGEPMRTGLDPDRLGSELAALGLRLVELLRPADIQQRYFQGRSDGLHASPNACLARVVVA